MRVGIVRRNNFEISNPYRYPSQPTMNSGPVDPAADPARDPVTLERIKTIFRRDLKLGPDIPIPDDMPFFGGDVDLDSLDILLLVTSIEKEFALKIPSEAVGKEVFQNVSTLVQYIQDRDAGAGSATGT